MSAITVLESFVIEASDSHTVSSLTSPDDKVSEAPSLQRFLLKLWRSEYRSDLATRLSISTKRRRIWRRVLLRMLKTGGESEASAIEVFEFFLSVFGVSQNIPNMNFYDDLLSALIGRKGCVATIPALPLPPIEVQEADKLFIFGFLQEMSCECMNMKNSIKKLFNGKIIFSDFSGCFKNCLQKRAFEIDKTHQCVNDPWEISEMQDFFLSVASRIFCNSMNGVVKGSIETFREVIKDCLGVIESDNNSNENVEISQDSSSDGQRLVEGLLNIVKNSCAAYLLEEELGPPSDLSSPLSPLSATSLSSIENLKRLQRCSQFMEASVLLSVGKVFFLSYPLPPINTVSSGFAVNCSHFKLLDMNLNRALCIIFKRGKENSSTTPETNPLPIQIRVVNLSLTIEHDFRAQLQQGLIRPVYEGSNQISVVGISASVYIDIDAEQGVVFRDALIDLGDVSNTCAFSNAGIVSEILAHALLDWFKEPLTGALQKALSQALQSALQAKLAEWSKDQWHVIRKTLGDALLLEVLNTVREHFPRGGFPF